MSQKVVAGAMSGLLTFGTLANESGGSWKQLKRLTKPSDSPVASSTFQSFISCLSLGQLIEAAVDTVLYHIKLIIALKLHD